MRSHPEGASNIPAGHTPISGLVCTSQLHPIALATWEDEGGSTAGQPGDEPGAAPPERTPLSDAELVQLRVRVIALENLVIALLVGAPEPQVAVAHNLAAYISPRPGYTPHPLTLHAASEMLSLLDRASRFIPAATS